MQFICIYEGMAVFSDSLVEPKSILYKKHYIAETTFLRTQIYITIEEIFFLIQAFSGVLCLFYTHNVHSS